jgi:hypothetical protein
MTALPLSPADGGGRFPGFDVLSQQGHWDDVTRGMIEDRLAVSSEYSFFTPEEAEAARALCDQLLYQRGEPAVPVARMVDARIAAGQTDGWHYDTMPPDHEAWRLSLAALDEDAVEEQGNRFHLLAWDEQTRLLARIQDLKDAQWHGMAASNVWSLWTRYACTAFYSHPAAWDEIGFAGPAYPRGYKNIGVNRLEPFEVRDADPGDDPLRVRP